EQPWVLLRQLFTDPATGVVTAIDPRRRRFHPRDSRFIGLRDQHCRHPRCDRAIADHDHVIRAAEPRHPHQRTRPLRSPQPPQGDTRLERPRRRPPTPTPHRRDHHPHRPHLPIPGTTRPATASVSFDR
ncbi:MAG: hypothetical protein ACRDOX_09655, partial [Nocardioides sp.]